MGDSELTTKVSNLIDGQVPDYIQADHPIFVDFLRQYYKFLESAQITITGTVDQVLLETASTSFLTLDGTDRFSSNDSSKIVFEDSTGKFEVGETITGGTSKATAKILVDDNETLYISANQKFKEGETITGGTSGATSTLVKYRANPVQNIQQLFEYADPDNTVDHFLDAFRDSFMESIPTSLASGVSKRNLIKQIRDLYAAKGTSEGHKLFFRILLGQEAEIYYPEKDMLRLSDGNWSKPIIIRCTSDTLGAVPADMVGKNITGSSSGTKAQIISEFTFQQGRENIVEFSLREDTIKGSGFTISETFTGISETADINMQFTIQGIVTNISVTDSGLLYNKGDSLTIDAAIGNGSVTAEVSEITSGGISDVFVESSGTGYKVGDAIKFTAVSADVDSVDARAFVSVVGGRLSTEDSTDSTAENILLEDGTDQQLVHSSILLDGTELADAASEPYAVLGTDRRFSDSALYYYPLYVDKRKAQVSSTKTGGAISSVKVVNAGSGYTNGTYYAAVSGDGNNQGTATGAVIRIVVRENKIASFGTTLATETTIHRSGSGYSFGSVRLTSGFTFSDPELTTTSDMGGSDGLILITPNVVAVKANAYIFDQYPGITFWMPSDNQNNAKSTFDSNIYSLFETRKPALNDGSQLRQEDGTTGTGLGDKLLSEEFLLLTDTYGTSSDGIVLETETFGESEQTELIRVFLVNSGRGYTSLPNLSIITENGANANLFANTTDIGKVTEIKVTDEGFKYSVAPDVSLNTNLILKDVVGTFLTEEELTTHNGSVVSYDSDTQKLVIDVAPNERINLEQSDSYNEGIQLEEFDSEAGSGFLLNNSAGVESNILLENEIGQILLDAHDANVFQISLETATDSSVYSNFGQSIKHVNTPDDRLVGENLETFITENTPDDTLVTSGKVLYDQVIFDGDQSDGLGNILLEDDGRILNENDSNNLILNGTDASGTDDGSELLIENETLGDQLALDGTTSIATDAGDEVLLEPGSNVFNLVGDTITSSSGATATILSQGTARAEASFGTTSTRVGRYSDNDSLISDKAIRVQDSYFYQQFSYEVRVNAAISEYMNELKASVHPAGFAPFGKIAISTQLSAGIGVTAAGVFDATVDDTFTPELASLFKLIFGPTIKVNHGVRENVLSTDGESSVFDSLLTENGVAIGDKLLEETDGDNLQFESGLDIAIENSPKSGDGSVLLETSTGGGLLLMETALGENGILNRSVSKVTKLNVTPQLVKTRRSYGAPLLSNTLPGSLFFDRPGVQLEAGNRDKAPIIMQDNLVLDGFDEYGTGAGDRIVYEDFLDNSTSSTVKINEDFTNPSNNLVLDGTDSSSLDANGSIILNGTDSSSSNGGNVLVLEPDTNTNEGSSLSISDIVSLNTVGYIESAGGDRNFTEEPEGSIVFEQSAASDELVLEDFIVFELNADEVRNEVIISENGQNILLETTGRFRDTEVGRIAVESGSEDNAFLKNGSDVNILHLETATSSDGRSSYLIGEDDTISAVDRSVNVVIESGLLENEKIMTEGSLIEFEDDTNAGTIPERNFGNRNVVPFTREARVHTELAEFRIALQDERDTNVFIALDGTDSSSTDAGDNIILNGTSAVLDIGGNILLDGTDAAQSDAGSAVILDASASGTDVGENLLLDSTGGRDDGDRIQLMSTNYNLVPGNEGGLVLLNGTDGSSTNAGDELLLESGTLEFIEQNTLNVSLGVTSEEGGLTLPISEISLVGAAQASAFDSTLGTFDSTNITFDAA